MAHAGDTRPADMQSMRHGLYSIVLARLEQVLDVAESRGEQIAETEEAMRALDALYVSGGRITAGPVCGDPA